MRFSITRKINLSNIDREIWPYETEDLTVDGADSFEEAAQKIDQLVYERRGYYRAISDSKKKEIKERHELEKMIPKESSMQYPSGQFQYPATPTLTPSTLPEGISNQPPTEFQL